MNDGKLVFSQIMSFIPKYQFDKCVFKYKGNYKAKTFTCWDQFLCMSFAQLSFRESLRDIEACLNAIGKKRYHLGLKHQVSKSTLAYKNETTDWRIYAEFAQILISKTRKYYNNDNDFKLDLKNSIYAIDSTTIDLCLSLFPLAKFRQHKAAVKLHTMLDLKCSIPTYINVTDGKVHDVNILDELVYEPGAFYIMDRAYIDFARLYNIKERLGYFVTRAKGNFKFSRLASKPIDKSTGLICDQIVKLSLPQSYENYPDKLRRIKFYDKDNNKYLKFLTNNFDLPALTIAELYRNRWKIELFFKWIKQHLRIKSFYGTSINAVKSQIWIAISIYVLVAYIKKVLKLEQNLYTILQIFSLLLFEKVDINQLFTNSDNYDKNILFSNSLSLFD